MTGIRLYLLILSCMAYQVMLFHVSFYSLFYCTVEEPACVCKSMQSKILIWL